jgi:hypothetical protein
MARLTCYIIMVQQANLTFKLTYCTFSSGVKETACAEVKN